MTDLMQREMQEIFYMVTGGMAVMMVGSTGRIILARMQSGKRLRQFTYLAFWLIAAYLFCQFLYRGSYGVISWYTLPAFGAGCILWKKGFYGILTLYENVLKYNGDKKHEQKDKRASESF